MAASPSAPKQWQLTKNETITLYESWCQNVMYILSLDNNFVPFLDATWQKQTAANSRRGLTDDASSVPESKRLTAAQKNSHLDLMLGQIANFCLVISRNSIVKHSTSLNVIWQKNSPTLWFPTLTRQTEVWLRIAQQVASLTQARDFSSSCIPFGRAPLY